MRSPAGAYYNENDPLKAEVIRVAIAAGAIAKGDVDERSIADVQPADLVGYTQCHFFAGGGFWSLALRYAGWPDDRPVWTGSCPCPSFSAAGKGGGFDDPRHLWPDWARLIRVCRPAAIFGEQADDAVGYGWLDLVQADLEAEDYAVGKAILGAASVGAPHIRQRIYFCADTAEVGRQYVSVLKPNGVFPQAHVTRGKQLKPCCDHASSRFGSYSHGGFASDGDVQRGGEHRLLAPDRGIGDDHDSFSIGRGTRRDNDGGNEREQSGSDGGAVGGSNALHSERRPLVQHGADGRDGQDERRTQAHGVSRTCGEVLISCDALSAGLQGHAGDEREWRGPGWLTPDAARSIAETGATRGYWADCDWWYGRDGKYRPIGPGLFPLAHGSPARVGRLRMYGDGIVVTAAQAFIEAYCEARG